jgi:hypothetical protein
LLTAEVPPTEDACLLQARSAVATLAFEQDAQR